ncbi:MAG: phosphoribosylglycinamide formyltransferase [Phycisphaerales bacterium]|nr:phosphoribosylglycinamide formyltransferase [Phycisphaerales bacterium]
MTLPVHPLRAAVLVSGGGTTAFNLIAAESRGELPVHIALVVAHRNDIPALTRCAGEGRNVVVLPGAAGSATSDALDALLTAHKIDLVLLAGYLRPFRVGVWAGRALNIHPALLPAFGGKGMYGMRVHEAVIAAGCAESGCTVHLVDDQYDHGESLVQRAIAVKHDETAPALAARVFAEECIAYPQAIRQWVARQR